MAIRRIESFVFDGSATLAKAIKKGYTYLSKADQALGSDDMSGITENTIFFTSPGRYSDGSQLAIQSIDEYIPQGCPSCSSDWANFGGLFSIPITETALDTYGVVGFSVQFNSLPFAGVASGMQDDSNNDGMVFFALGDLATRFANIFIGVRASDNTMYLKVLDTAVEIAVSTGLTGTNSSKYRGYHNNDGTCTISSVIPTTGVWYTVELKYKFSATAGHVLLYVNGVKVAETATNIAFSTNFRNGAFLAALNSLVTANQGTPESISNLTNYFDDFYMLDSTGPRNTDYLGNYRVRSTYPNVNFINEGYASTTEYSAMQSDDDDSSYVSIASGQRQVFELNDLTDIGSTIKAVQYNFTTYFENNANIRIVPLSQHGGVLHSGIVNQIPATGGGYYYHMIPMNSSLINGGNWTLDQMNNGYHGFTIFS